MTLRNADGRKIEIEVVEFHGELEIDEAYYADSDEDVSEEDLTYIMDRYSAEIEEALKDRQLELDFGA